MIIPPDADRKTADMMPEYLYLLFSSQLTVEKFPKTAKNHRQNREISAILLCVFAKIINIVFHIRNEFKPTVKAPEARFCRELTTWTVARKFFLWYNIIYEYMQLSDRLSADKPFWS